MKKAKVESFELDHTNLSAPFVRRAGVLKGKKGDAVEKYDLRFVTPNIEEMDAAATHTLEHLLSLWLRENTELDIIDLSPMGCKTGFYMTVWSINKPQKQMEEAISAALNNFAAAAQKFKKKDVPATTKKACGNYKLHSLPKAKELLQKTQKKGGFVPLKTK